MSVVVGLGEVTFIDSTGIGVLVGASRRMQGRSGMLSLLHPTSSVYNVLKVTGLTKELAVIPSTPLDLTAR